jgi:biopolymer transport protein ExbD
MRLGHPRAGAEAWFDLTPMIDVVLLLIIFFMLSSQFAQAQRRPIDVPNEAGEQAAAESADLVIVDIDGPDRYFVSGARMNLSEVSAVMEKELKQRGAGAPPLDLVVRASRTSPAAELNRLADALAKVGVRNWKLATSGEG